MSKIKELEPAFKVYVDQEVVLVASSGNRQKAYAGKISKNKSKLKVGEALETNEDEFNYHEVCGVLKLLRVYVPSYQELSKLLK